MPRRRGARSGAAGRRQAIWRTGAFAGEFGDAFIKNTELEGGQVAASIRVLVDVVSEALRRRPTPVELSLLAPSGVESLRLALQQLLVAASVTARLLSASR